MKNERIMKVGTRKGDSYPIMVWIDDELKCLNCDDAVFLATELLDGVSEVEGGDIYVYISRRNRKYKIKHELDDIFFWFALVIAIGCLALLAIGTIISYF